MGSPNLTILSSRTPKDSTLRQKNALLNSIVLESNIASPARRYISRVSEVAEKDQTKNAILEKQLKEQSVLLKRRREAKKGKKVVLKGQYSLSSQEIVEGVEKAEREAKDKKKGKKRKKRTPTPGTEEEEEEDSIGELAL